jgi:hypothetical protein
MSDGWRLWSQWVLANAAPFLVVYILIASLGTLLGHDAQGVLAYLVLVAMLVTLQWAVLRRQVSRALWWLLATLVGIPVGAAASIPVLAAMDTAGQEVAGVLVGITLFGGVLGAVQWLVLKRHVRSAAWWIPASAASWLLYVGVDIASRKAGLLLPGYELFGRLGQIEVAMLGYAFLSYGVITGLLLVWLLARRPSVPTVKE